MTLRRLSGLDSAFLTAERPGNPVHVMAIMVLDPSTVPNGYSFAGFRDFLAQRLHVVPPLRRRLLTVPGGLARPFWVEEPELDLDHHLYRAAVPSPGDPGELAAMAGEMMEIPLDRRRPLWQMVVVEGLEGGRIAVLAKLHHAMMDGVAGVGHMASLFSTTPEPNELPAPGPRAKARVPGNLALLAGTLPWLARQPLRAARAAASTAASVLERARPRRGQAAAPAVPVARTWLNAPISPHRAVAYTSLPISEIKALGSATGATVNDVLLAVVAGAVRGYLDARGVLPDEPLAAGVPFTSRKQGDGRANAVSSVTVGLATNLRNPCERLRAIRDATAAAKQQRFRTVGDDLAAWVEVPPPLFFSLMARAYVDLGLGERFPPVCNLIVSSVPGSNEPLYFAGNRLIGIHPLGPIYSGIALNVTAMGGGDSVDIGLVGCRGLLPDLWDLCDALPAALKDLAAAVHERPQRSAAH
jgi:WS/DGAT/MGAT family acyltransferase